MSDITNEVIPFAIYFIAIIFYVASFKSKKNVSSNNKPLSEYKVDNEKMRSFLSDAEKKLKALKDLHNQKLIKTDLYWEKTSQIANVVSRIMENDIFEYGQNKNKQIINEIKMGIENRPEIDNVEEKDIDLDKILNSIDEKIKNKF